jgi:AcrR family transcriptional regulator
VGRGATQRREAARQEMREDILRAAREMVEREGVANLSLRAIARTLGYSPAALYEYFPSKEAIAKALYFGGADGLAGRMQRTLQSLPADTPPIDAKKALGRAYRSYALENRELFLLVFGSGDAFGTLSKQFEEGGNGYEALMSVVNAGLQSGDFVELPAQALAFTAWASVHGFVMLELACVFDHDHADNEAHFQTDISPDELFELHMNLIDTGMRRR